MHAALVLSTLLYPYAAEMLARDGVGHSTTSREFSHGFPVGVAVLAGLDALIAYYVRQKKLFPALEKLRGDLNDAVALKEWRFSTLLSLVHAESIALLGFALRFLGSSRRVSWPFFAAALILMLLWRPQMDGVIESPSTGTQ